jgi:hypothetical protein
VRCNNLREISVLTAVSMKMAVFWVVAAYSLVKFYQNTRRNNSEDSHL